MTFRIELPLRIESVANKREHWGAKARRVKAHRDMVALVLPKHKLPALPCTVTLTRIGQKHLDGDNLQSGFKAVRDEVAAKLGVDDADKRVTWLYKQQRGQPRQYACLIEISATESACG